MYFWLCFQLFSRLLLRFFVEIVLSEELQMKNILRGFLIGCSVLCLFDATADDVPLSGLRALQVENEFRAFLAAMPVQVEAGGAKVFTLQDKSVWLVSVGATATMPPSPQEALRRRLVSRKKAESSALEELNGVNVKATTLLTTSDSVATVKGVEVASSETKLDESILTEAKGLLKGARPVGTWLNKDESLFFTAIGVKIK